MRRDDEPRYNIQAVERMTRVPAATLRSWERRYGFPAPRRTATARRLFSQREVEAIRWVKAQREQGLSVAQAIHLVQNGAMTPLLELPPATGAATHPPRVSLVRARPSVTMPGTPTVAPGDTRDRNLSAHPRSMVGALVDAMRRYDEAAVEATLSSAFARFPADVVLVEVITPMLVAVGEQWANGELPSSAEHFASNIIHRRLCALLGEQPAAAAGSRPIVVLGCVAGEHHELGLLMLAVFLRWAGARVVYLGADVPMEDLLQVLRETGAAGLCLSATAPSSTAALHATVSQLRQAGVQAPIFAGGAAAVGAPPVGAHTLSGDLRSVCAAVLATLGS